MTERFKKLLPVILEHEGGATFTNDPADPGGATKYGISLRFLKTQGKAGDMDHDGDVDAEDTKLLDQATAAKVYYDKFYLSSKAELLPTDRLALQHFDHAVNAGLRSAAKLLQRTAKVAVDGAIGPMTLQAVNMMFYEVAEEEYYRQRCAFYVSLANDKPKLKKFLKGWLNRVRDTRKRAIPD